MNTEAGAKRPRKIAIIGMGAIGEELWKELTEDGKADNIVVYNRSNKWDNEAFKAKMIAVDQANIIRNEGKNTSQFKLTTNLQEALDGAEIVVVTAGVPRKDPKQPRSELLALNCEVIDPIAKAAGEIAPNATYIVATNPVDTMAQRFAEQSNIDKDRIIGLSGVLDRARMIQSICNQLKISPDCIKDAQVMGEHGATMIPVLENVVIQRPGQQPEKLLDILERDPEGTAKRQEIIDATVKGGARLVERLKTSDHIAPAAALEVMIDKIIATKWRKEEQAPVFASAYSNKEGIFIGRRIQWKENGTFDVLTPPIESWGKATQEAWCKSVKAVLGSLGDIPGRKADRSAA